MASGPTTWRAPASTSTSSRATVVIHQARVLAAPDADHVELEIVCGKGTYVRSLARDLAAGLGACGHVCGAAPHPSRAVRIEATAVTLEQSGGFVR